jgi:hypothetical protein
MSTHEQISIGKHFTVLLFIKAVIHNTVLQISVSILARGVIYELCYLYSTNISKYSCQRRYL